ncbi:unnamed protein product [Symbiodinium natans]|uniref:Uncharacterized protein n=1 Tax=Symbiodinium natans TaxID=878477 RepID=A0A812UX20_9DINO|nr:unnamed protein product [Symbiodinium natans]
MFKAGKKRPTLQRLIGALVDDIQRSADEPDAASAASSAFTLPDLPVSKIQGVRAGKGAAWLARQESATEMAVGIYTSRPIEHVTAWLLKSQKMESWLAAEPSERPLVQLTTPDMSVTVQALCEYYAAITCIPEASDIWETLNGNLA